MNAYTEEIYESEQVQTVTKRLRLILDVKYENAYFNKVMEKQCQHLIKIRLGPSQDVSYALII